MRTLYGPVHSWRFGRSLGVDPLAAREKQCPFSCIYCQYGITERPCLGRLTFVPAERLRADIQAIGDVNADCVTFAGLGEPTLAANLPELVAQVRRAFSLPVILLTGGGLMPSSQVRGDLLCFDAVVAKLDAPDEALFRQINRPFAGFPYALSSLVEGIRQFRQVYGRKLIVQMMFVQANKLAASQMADLARSLDPDQVQLNTPLQPALGNPVSQVEMAEIAQAFAGLAVCSVYESGEARIKPRFL